MKKRISLKIGSICIFIAGICIGAVLLWGILEWWDRISAAKPNAVQSETAEILVDYPFFSGEEGWSLVLRESGGESVSGGDSAARNFCLYDETGQLLQEFPCAIAAKELVFRFDELFYYGKDMAVFPADAPQTGVEGLCYRWENERKRFAGEPVTIPWYQEGSVKKRAFLVCGVEEDGANENVETNAIYRIHERLGRAVELRRWTLRKDAATGEESLCIRDCLEEQDIYVGKVQRYETGGLENEKYYQYLFWEGLKNFWGEGSDSPIRIVEGVEMTEYEDKEAFFAHYGFAAAEPFYEYYDRFHDLILELYFDPQTGRGCGIRYYYDFNDDLKKRASRDGFAFDEAETAIWEPEDTFSTLTVSGEDTSRYATGYREIYEYTDDDKLSSFEARGMDRVENEPMEVSLLSMDYIYRDDGTLCHKEYRHYPKFFSTTDQSQSGDYDEQGRLVYQYGYITHGAMEYYYLYEGDSMEPDYCLFIDWGWSAYIRMFAYDSGH